MLEDGYISIFNILDAFICGIQHTFRGLMNSVWESKETVTFILP